MGVNKLLKAGIEGEKEQLEKASVKPKSVKATEEKKQSSKVKRMPVEEKPNKVQEEEPKKHPGGRPTNKSKGKTSRKQYTLTLIPDDYSKIMELADEDGISFSKYIERAVNEYIDNHKRE